MPQGRTNRKRSRATIFTRAAQRWPEIAGEMRDLELVERELNRARELITSALAHPHSAPPTLETFAAAVGSAIPSAGCEGQQNHKAKNAL
jgi:hypothetical protein